DITFPLNRVQKVVVRTDALFDGDDWVTVDASGGNPIPAGGLEVHCGQGVDHFVVTHTGPIGTAFEVRPGQVTANFQTFAYTLDGVDEMRLESYSDRASFLVDGTAGVSNLVLLGTAGPDKVDIEAVDAGTQVWVGCGDNKDVVVLGQKSG